MSTTEIFTQLANRRAIIDRKAVTYDIDAIVQSASSPAKSKSAVVARLKDALHQGRTELRRRMCDEKSTGRALTSGYAFLTDQIIRLVHDFITTHLFKLTNPTDSERLTLIAVGGYGRAEMALHSDVDLLFLTPYKITPWHEQVIETMMYMLWDLKWKVGQATRTVAETIRLSKEDLTIRTAILEARFLWGDANLYDELRTSFYRDVVHGTAPQFITEKLGERDARHKRMGDSRYVVEPNLKEGKGGLRDLHTLFWIGKYIHRVYDPAALVEKGLFSAEEYRAFVKASDYLWTVRCHLHDLTNRAEDRLTFDVQRELASRLNYTDRPGASGVERFMKHYFLTAKQVGELTRVFLAHLDSAQKKKPLWSLFSLKRSPKKLEGFRLDSGRLTIPSADFFKTDPVRLLRLFYLADYNEVEVHPTAMRQAGRDISLITQKIKQSRTANETFLNLLCSRKNPEIALRWMNDAGVFGRFVPDFGRVVAQMQYDMYHHYTVDEHTIRAIGLLAKIEKGELKSDHPLASALMGKLLSRRVLYVAVLLHDIAKGRRGDHSELGADIALKLCPRFGLTPAETETVAWLVRHHLLMSNTAFKRDLSDYKTILDFVDIVRSPERLRLLLALTVVDIRAVGPNVWNSWKGQLLTDLFNQAEELLVMGHKQTGRAERIAAKQQHLNEALGWPEARFTAYAKRFFDAYWIAETPEILVNNASLVQDTDQNCQTVGVSVSQENVRGGSLLSVYVPDHPGLFYRLAGAITLAGATIVDAKIHTLRNGMALDNLTIQSIIGGRFDDPQKIAKLKPLIEDALANRVRLSDLLNRKPVLKPKADAFNSEPAVLIDNKASNRFTVIEINAVDRPALLFSLTYAFFTSKVTIHSAHIATFGERAIDVFYVTDLTSEKITNTNRLKALERRLFEAAGGVMADEKTTHGSEAFMSA
jgi:[protein-PII] uridylyltransferase